MSVPFNPMDRAFLADPYPMYHRLRTEEPVAGFIAARFGAPVPQMGLSMLDRDPPDHTRLRALVSKAFTPRVVETLRPHIQQIVDGLVDKAEDHGSMDLIEEFAYPLPVI